MAAEQKSGLRHNWLNRKERSENNSRAAAELVNRKRSQRVCGDVERRPPNVIRCRLVNAGIKRRGQRHPDHQNRRVGFLEETKPVSSRVGENLH
jgi:hypothetical protein